MKFILSAALFQFAALNMIQAAEPASGSGHGEIFTTAEGIRFGVWPKIPAKAAPVVFVLASSLEETLSSTYFRQSGGLLAQEGVISVSIDLPCHGQDEKPDAKGLAGWRLRCDRGEDLWRKQPHG